MHLCFMFVSFYNFGCASQTYALPPPLQVEVLFELIKGLIKDLDGTSVDEVHIGSFYRWDLIFNFDIQALELAWLQFLLCLCWWSIFPSFHLSGFCNRLFFWFSWLCIIWLFLSLFVLYFLPIAGWRGFQRGAKFCCSSYSHVV